MADLTNQRGTRYRLWTIAAGQNGEAAGAEQPELVALNPAESGTMSAPQAARYVQAFNRTAAAQGRRIRAVAVPVAIHYQGEPRPGQALGSAAGMIRQGDLAGPRHGPQPGSHSGPETD